VRGPVHRGQVRLRGQGVAAPADGPDVAGIRASQEPEGEGVLLPFHQLPPGADAD